MDGAFLSLDDFAAEKDRHRVLERQLRLLPADVPSLTEIEAEAGQISQILIVRAGDVEANRAQGLKSRMVLDDGFTMGRAFGADGTPSAIVLDEDGKVASPLAVGADAVLTLLDETLALGTEEVPAGESGH